MCKIWKLFCLIIWVALTYNFCNDIDKNSVNIPMYTATTYWSITTSQIERQFCVEILCRYIKLWQCTFKCMIANASYTRRNQSLISIEIFWKFWIFPSHSNHLLTSRCNCNKWQRALLPNKKYALLYFKADDRRGPVTNQKLPAFYPWRDYGPDVKSIWWPKQVMDLAPEPIFKPRSNVFVRS